MRILHIVAGLPPGGGIAGSVPSLCRHLRKLGHEVALATLDGPLSEAARAAEAAGVRLVRFAPSWPHALYFSWPMLRGLPALMRAADVVHVHGAWTFPVWWGCCCALRAHKPLVMSPRGALNPVYLRHSAWKKRLVGWLDHYFLRRAFVIHATSEAEKEWIEKFLVGNRQSAIGKGTVSRKGAKAQSTSVSPHSSFLRPRIAVVPNGVDIEDFSRKGAKTPSAVTPLNLAPAAPAAVEPLNPCTSAQRDGTFEPSRPRTVLYLGRLHPLKGLELLVDAWAQVKESVNSKPLSVNGDAETQPKTVYDSRLTVHGLPWQLFIAGPDEQGMRARLVAQAEKLGLNVSCKPLTVNREPAADRSRESDQDKRLTVYGSPFTDIIFLGPVYGEEKMRLMATADLFVLPTRSENFGIVVAEALACGVPVITTKGAPWAELEKCVNALMRECLNEGEGNKAIRQSGNKAFLPARAGWWIDIGAEPLAAALREAMSLTDEARRAMGENGQRLVERKYRWETVAEKMAGVYRGGSDKLDVNGNERISGQLPHRNV